MKFSKFISKGETFTYDLSYYLDNGQCLSTGAISLETRTPYIETEGAECSEGASEAVGEDYCNSFVKQIYET